MMVGRDFILVNGPVGKRLNAAGLPRHTGTIRNDPAAWMRVLATFMLMVSLLALSVMAASADITRPPCGARLRAADMCHAVGLPGSTAEAVKKPGLCFLCLAAPAASLAAPVQPLSRIAARFGAVVPVGARRSLPWRPPRA